MSAPRRRARVLTHGYGGYTNGCRCDECRTAKAAYQRERRRAASQIAQQYTSNPFGTRGSKYSAWADGAVRYVAAGVKHGTRYAHDERGCRCRECTDAHRLSWRSRNEGRRAS